MMRVGNGNGQRVGGIGTGYFGPWKQARDHRMDLRLLRSAGADNCFLDQGWGIFAYLDPRPCRAHQDDAASLAELQCRLGVLVDEDLLDRGGNRCALADQGFQLVGECRKPRWQGRFRVGLDLSVGNMRDAIALSLDQAPAGRTQPGVETEDFQASFSSSSSGTS